MHDMVATASKIEVLNPTASDYGEANSPIAPRLETLEGKVIGLLWNGKPLADVALKTVGAIIKERYPTADLRFFPGTIRFTKELLAQATEECDAVITCCADCGACSSWLIHDSITLERRGIPSVTIASKGFEHDCEATAAAFGMPSVRYVVVPRVYNALTAQQAADQSRPVVDDIVRMLTVNDVEAATVLAEAEADHFTFSGGDTIEALDAFLHKYPPEVYRNDVACYALALGTLNNFGPDENSDKDEHEETPPAGSGQ